MEHVSYMRCQHDWSLLRGRKSYNIDLPGVWCHCVRHIAHNLAREALFTIWIDNGERDGVLGVCNHSKVPVVPPIGAPVKRVVIVVLIGEDVKLLAIDDKTAVLDAICVSAGNTTEMWMDLALERRCFVEPEDDITLDTVLALDEQVCNRRAVWNKQSSDAFGRNLILAVCIRARCVVLRKRSAHKQRKKS